MKISRARVLTQVALHALLLGHVLAYYWLDWRRLGALDLQSFFHHFLGKGILTAGAVLGLLVYGSALIFGRLFCSWGCHFGATQDLAAWGLRRLGWKAPLVRTRFLHHAPILVLAGVFLWPLVERWTEEGFALEPPDLAAVGPWEMLPGWLESTLTFLVCGGAILLFLGTRGFCRFVCPYGAFFRLTDWKAPFQVRRVGACVGCGQGPAPCTRACPTAIDVHAETASRGRVVSVDCVRCHLCIEACPAGALAHTTAGDAERRREQAGAPRPGDEEPPGPRRAYDLSLPGEIAVGLCAVVTFLCTDLVYGGHFLAASLGFLEGGVLLAALAALRRDGETRGVPFAVRKGKTLTLAGVTALGLLALTAVPILEAGVFRLLRADGIRHDLRAAASRAPWEAPGGPGSPIDRQALEVAERRYRAALGFFPGDRGVRTLLVGALGRLGDPRALDEANELYRRFPGEDTSRIREWAHEHFGAARPVGH